MKRANVAFFVPHLGCPHCCSFCDQREIAGQSRIPGPAEIAETAKKALETLGEKALLSEIAFFGGSFTLIDRELMESLLQAAAPFVGNGGFKGIRISTRPDGIDDEILTVLRKYGVSAIELGAQSMDSRVLEMNNRGHSPEDVRRAAGLIRAGGFELGLQMMTGLYGSSPNDDMNTAEQLAVLRPRTVRIYPTIVIEGTALAKYFRSGMYEPQELEQAVGLCTRLLEFFTQQGIEVIRLGLHAMESLERNYVAGPWHPAFRELCENRIYLNRARAALAGVQGVTALLAVKPGAVSKLVGQHRSNIRALEKESGIYIKVREKAGLPDYTVILADNG